MLAVDPLAYLELLDGVTAEGVITITRQTLVSPSEQLGRTAPAMSAGETKPGFQGGVVRPWS